MAVKKKRKTIIHRLASRIARAEGKKHQASIGDIREILGILCDIFHKDHSSRIANAFHKEGAKRAKRKGA